MPPRASAAGRNARKPSREPEPHASQDRSGHFVRPQLPQLHGTPSSRRQYTYGSPVEPPPRPGAGLQRMDLSNAVNRALTRHDADDGVFVRPRIPQRGPTVEEMGEDELAQGNPTPQRTVTGISTRAQMDTNVSLAGSEAYRSILGGSDADSIRSFGMESDYYGDATIASTPGSTPAPAFQQNGPSVPGLTAQSLPAQGLLGIPQGLTGTRPLVDVEPVNSWPRQPGASSKTEELRIQKERPIQDNDGEEEEDSEDEENAQDERPNKSPDVPRPRRPNTNTPAPNRVLATNARQLRPRKNLIDTDQDAEVEPTAHAARLTGITKSSNFSKNPSSRRAGMVGARATQGNGPNVRSSQGPDRALQIRNDNERPSLFAQARELKQKTSSFTGNRYPSDQQRRGVANHREIVDAEGQAASHRNGILSTWPFTFVQRFFERRARPVDDVDDVEDDEYDLTVPVNYWLLLHPLTYLQTLTWLFDIIMGHITGFFHGVWDSVAQVQHRRVRHRRIGMAPKWVVSSLGLLILGILAWPLMSRDSLELSNPFSDRAPIHWPHLGDITNRLGNFVPSIPSIPWPSYKGSGDLFDSWEPSDNDRARDIVQKFSKDLATLKKVGNLHETSLEKLKTVVPKVVHMELRNGKPAVAQEFWHALRDLIKEDGAFITVEKQGRTHEITSKHQWQAIVNRLAKDPTWKSTIDRNVGDVEDRLDGKIAKYWDTWVKNNNDKISQLLGPALDKVKAAGSGQEFDTRISKLVKDQLRSGALKDVIVTREQFLSHLKGEFASHRHEIQAEIQELQPQFEKLIRESVQTALKDTPQGVSKADVTTLVKNLVRESIANLNLEAMANGKIHVHWDAVLKNQVNYFGVGAGATIDKDLTAVTFDLYDKGAISEKAYKKGIRGINPLPPIAALAPWDDEGDCWCAARSINRRGNPHGAALSVQLAHHIVPQHIVVEHILPGATTDPDARPRDIEVYAHIADPVIRERVLDFAATHFPENTDDWNYTPPEYGPAFVKIGQFVYEGAELHEGVHVHRLSSELSSLGAETDQVVVRSISNYGAKDHTCFYRVRLFGERPGASI